MFQEKKNFSGKNLFDSLASEGFLDEKKLEILNFLKGDRLENALYYNFITEARLNKFLKEKFGVDAAVKPVFLPVTDVEKCLKLMFLPFEEVGGASGKIKVALEDVPDEDLKAEVRSLLAEALPEKTAVFYFARKSVIKAELERNLNKQEQTLEPAIKLLNMAAANSASGAKKGDFLTIKDPIVEFVDAFIKTAITLGASEAVLEPEEALIRLGFKVLGVRREAGYFVKEQWGRVLNRFKILSGMNVTEVRSAQNGRINFGFFGKSYEVWVSTFVSLKGESLRLKIILKEQDFWGLEQLGLSKQNLQKIVRLLERPEGLIMVSGAPYSGKTFTFYGLLKAMAAEGANIISIENQPQRNAPFLRQVLPSADFDSAFCDALGVDEVDTKESASAILSAALSGQKAVGVLRGADAFSVIQTFKLMGIEKDMLIGTISGVINQRLLRKLCEKCKEAEPLSQEHLTTLRLAKTDVKMLYKKRGCEACNNTGYSGLSLVCEVLSMEPELEDLITENVTKRYFLDMAKRRGFSSIFEDARLRVLQGITDISELKRVIL